jgi:DNA invertase Pin-like site-specific DNA recombinase
MSRIDKEALSLRAAAYVRMSTEHQQYSTCNQMEAIRNYAKLRNLEIVKEYSDEGKSGLSLQGRDGLSQLIRDVQSGEADFSTVLVYDVSRWGRFQDADESAYYEYVCRRCGIRVQYCAEQFENDGTPLSTIIKSIKRAMAGEYSRELSNKVFQGACRLAQKGYKLGGNSGYGVRRMLVDQNGRHKTILQPGERKNIQTDRVIIVPGPSEEIRVVHWIYGMFIDERKGELEITRLLNARGIRTETGRAWSHEKVHLVLTSEKYIGNNIYHRRSCKLKGKLVTNPPEKWIRADGVFQGIVDRERFLQAQKIIRWRNHDFTDAELLGGLRDLLKLRGRLTSTLIKEDRDLPCVSHVAQRFGSLSAAYQVVGYKPRLDYRLAKVNRRLFEKNLTLIAFLIEQFGKLGATVKWNRRKRTLLINDEVRVNVFVMRHCLSPFGTARWFIRRSPRVRPDILIAGRMDARNDQILDYFCLPGLDAVWRTKIFGEENGLDLDAYRFPSLDFFLGLVARIKLQEAA